ncbi:aliphatic sulfonate ABC transporter substrate-binding protein [Heliophilum fasciatum]|uniref:Putative aliphatic sulfonates-binding protein n=1 Tax=Heliophilum fasciatum TaxID=35700 RepID=A0A4R2RIL2_9FIRM|nr:aliphatic sulfonate ABC transporter substrate-binding protein [Heliophilum fasciatum]MCW2278499.1 sulfonate transport system substrate-binding protein [Heliophilum fasciatum]TCP63630.1 sulfonate transport system substrate-binding protein [Heliophilum fasciatum]
MKNIRLLTFLILMTVVSTFMIGCGSNASKSNETNAPATEGNAKEVRLAYVPLPHYSPLLIAKQNGWIEESLKPLNVNVKWNSFSIGPLVSESFAAGGQDVGVMGDFPAIIGRSANVDTRIVGITSTSPQSLALVVPKNSSITSPADLKGKKVATTKGSYGQYLLSQLLESKGLTVNDIKFIHMSMDDVKSALLTGDIDAGVIWDPLLTILEDQNAIRIIADGTGYYQGIAVMIADHKFAAANPKVVTAILAAYERGAQFIKSNPTEAKDLVAKEVKIPPAQLAKIIDRFNYQPAITPEITEELKKSEAFMAKNQIIKNSVDIDKFVDKSYFLLQ